MSRKRKYRRKKTLPLLFLIFISFLLLIGIREMATSNHTYASPYTNLTYHTPTAVKAVGIDVSQHQGVIDWEAVKADGIDFAFIRGAYRGTTSGAIAVDSRFETNIEGAQSAGIQVGVYIYSQAVTEKEAQEEALFMLHLVSGYKIDLPIVMDYEFDESHAGRLAAADLSAEERTGIVLAFCDAVAEEGYAPMVYGNAHMLENNLNADKIAEKAWIWYANYNDTALISDCDVWQYTESGSVDGISTNVDCDLCFIRLHRLGRL